MEEVKRLRDKIVAVGKDQVVIDKVYEELVKMMTGGLVAVKVRRRKSRQQWFTKEIGKQRKAFHGAEREWLKRGDKEAKWEKRKSMWRREELIRSAEESRQNELESLIRSPRRWWSVVRKSGLTDGRKKTSDIGKVYDEVGVMRQVKEAVEVWMRHFERGC